MRLLTTTICLLLTCFVAFAGANYQNDNTIVTTYTVTDISGNHVTGETVRLTIKSMDNVNYYDFSDGTWGDYSSNTTINQTMLEDADGGFYFYTVTFDVGTLVSGDYVFIVSNDSATYGDLQAATVHIDNLIDNIRIYR